MAGIEVQTGELVEDRQDAKHPVDGLLCAFVQGAKWWEYQKTGFTMWQGDQRLAWITAECRRAAGLLGKSSV